MYSMKKRLFSIALSACLGLTLTTSFCYASDISETAAGDVAAASLSEEINDVLAASGSFEEGVSNYENLIDDVCTDEDYVYSFYCYVDGTGDSARLVAVDASVVTPASYDGMVYVSIIMQHISGRTYKPSVVFFPNETLVRYSMKLNFGDGTTQNKAQNLSGLGYLGYTAVFNNKTYSQAGTYDVTLQSGYIEYVSYGQNMYFYYNNLAWDAFTVSVS